MKVKLKNTTDNIIVLTDIGDLVILPNGFEEYDTDTYDLALSDILIGYISTGDVVVNNYHNDMSAVEGVRWLVTQTERLPFSNGKLSVHSTSKHPGLYVYWTGRGDNMENGNIGDGESILLSHKIGDPKSQKKYIDFCCLDNKSQLHEGTVIFSGAKMGDSGTCSMVTSVMPVTAGVNTNYRLHDDYLIIPANGDGDIELLGDITNINPTYGCFVEMVPDETGVQAPTFWNADINKDTRKFENITPAPDGDGRYNLFAAEIVISRFVNHINLLGEGSLVLQSEDSVDMTHGMRLLHHINTSTIDGIEDHDWQFSVVLTLQRDKTY